jgi:hypothetical protein
MEITMRLSMTMSMEEMTYEIDSRAEMLLSENENPCGDFPSAYSKKSARRSITPSSPEGEKTKRSMTQKWLALLTF